LVWLIVPGNECSVIRNILVYFQLKIDIQLLARLHSGLANFKSGWCESVSNKLFNLFSLCLYHPLYYFLGLSLTVFLSSFFLSVLCVYVSVCLVAHNFRNLVVLEVSFKSQLNLHCWKIIIAASHNSIRVPSIVFFLLKLLNQNWIQINIIYRLLTLILKKINILAIVFSRRHFDL